MAYEILAFDGLSVSPYIRRGDVQDMGTGSAQTHFVSLPGGGFYRPRRNKRSPQGIRPVTKSGVLWGDDAEDVRQQLDAWRAKIGVYGKLTVRYFDGSYRWQWAELQSVEAPVASSVKGNYVPITLIWQTAAQHWNGLVQGAGWEVGDGTFYLGDGTAEVGQQSYEFTLSAGTSSTLYVSNAGNIHCTNLIVTYTVATQQSSIALINRATGQRVSWAGALLGKGLALRINTRNMTIVSLGPERDIVSITRAFNTISVVTSDVHGLTSGDDVEFAGTIHYDGVWRDVEVLSNTSFRFRVPGDLEAYSVGAVGTVRRYAGQYGSTIFSDVARWLVLKPGSNEIVVATGSSQAGDTLLFEFFDAWG